MEKLHEILDSIFSQTIHRIILSSPETAGDYQKMVVRRGQIREEIQYQAEKYTKTQVFHENFTEREAKELLLTSLQTQFRQMDAFTTTQTHQCRRSKKGKLLYRQQTLKNPSQEISLAHNREKQYILKEGEAIPPMVDLGILTPEGAVVQSKFDKFKQINRFVEMVDDCIPAQTQELTVIDFGCGKSYLTFILYDYLTSEGNFR